MYDYVSSRKLKIKNNHVRCSIMTRRGRWGCSFSQSPRGARTNIALKSTNIHSSLFALISTAYRSKTRNQRNRIHKLQKYLFRCKTLSHRHSLVSVSICTFDANGSSVIYGHTLEQSCQEITSGSRISVSVRKHVCNGTQI